MIVQRLKWYLTKMNILDPAQSGFIAGRSTLGHILQLHDQISKSIANQRYAVAVFLDIERAYGKVWRKGLLAKLFSLGIKGRIFS